MVVGDILVLLGRRVGAVVILGAPGFVFPLADYAFISISEPIMSLLACTTLAEAWA